MKTDSPFLDLEKDRPAVQVWFQGQALSLPNGANLAAALLAAGVRSFGKSPTSGADRGPFCMMGACFECQVDIEGVATQACMVEVVEGMRVCDPSHVSGVSDVDV